MKYEIFDIPVVIEKAEVAESYKTIDEFFNAIKDKHWASHYIKLVTRAKNRIISEYTEKHHIIPKCLGGSNKKENLVKLTAEEHFMAHKLLICIYPENLALIRAAALMGSVHVRLKRSNNKMFGWLRRTFAEKMKGHDVSEETKAKISAANLGREHSKESRLKMSLSRTGKKFSPDRCARMSERRKGVSFTDEHRANMVKAWKTRPPATEETRAKLSAALIGNTRRKDTVVTDETRKKLSDAGKLRKDSEETIAKRAAANTGKKRTPEQIANMLAGKAKAKLEREASFSEKTDIDWCENE